MTADFLQIQGIYESHPTGRFVGGTEQISHERVGEIRTQWSICVPNMDDRVMIISRNGENKTVLVERDFTWAWKIMTRKVLAIGGARGLFDCLVRGIGDSHVDYHFTCLENIWKKTKSHILSYVRDNRYKKFHPFNFKH